MADPTIKPVRFKGGPLDGTVNDLDYAEHELEEMLAEGYVWDYTPGTIYSGAAPVIERYQITRDDDGDWVFEHIGTVDQPILEQPIAAVFTGGPRDGETTRFLGGIRDQLWLATSHYPGYVLVHHGDEPLAGWQMEPTELTWEQIRDRADAPA